MTFNAFECPVETVFIVTLIQNARIVVVIKKGFLQKGVMNSSK